MKIKSEPRETYSINLRKISTRKWLFGILPVLFLVSLVIVFAERVPLFKEYQKLAILFITMSVASTFFPLPIIPILLWVAKYYNFVVVAFVGTVGTCIANLNDYYIFHYLYRLERVKKIQNTKIFQRGVKWFKKVPFLAILGINFIPVPIDVIRVLAVSAGYKRRLYVLATFMGRFPRYLIITYLGYEFKPSTQTILIILAITIIIGLSRVLYSKIKQRIRREKEEALEAEVKLESKQP